VLSIPQNSLLLRIAGRGKPPARVDKPGAPTASQPEPDWLAARCDSRHRRPCNSPSPDPLSRSRLRQLTGALLLKLSEKISEPVGHGRLKDVVFTEAPSDSVLNMA
jgi:hypothetical protein